MNKKTRIILLAFALVMSLTQCKKNNETNTTNEGEKVFITLNVSKGNNSKLDVDPPHVNFENGDVIHVASNGVYVGSLEYNGTNFEGEISNATEEQPLYFYLLGNVTPTETLTAGTTTTYSVNISDQTGDLPVIACAPSNEYFGTTNNFTATLRNKCALVKFNVTTASSSATCMIGFNNKVMVDFSTNTMTSCKDGSGVIKLQGGSGEKWAILLPQDALDANTTGAYADDGTYYGVRSAVPVITANGYLSTGIELAVTSAVDLSAGILNGEFTINSVGDKVRFSQGNLQYQASTGTWRFAEHQWSFVGGTNNNDNNFHGNVAGSSNNNISSTYDGWIDLFGWGTSGWNNGNTYYQPYDYESNNSGYDYGPTNGSGNTFSLTGTYANADWGVYNAISNGSSVPNQWRTLKNGEWSYIVNNRTTTSGIRYAKAKVNDVNGVILLPDNWNVSYYTLNDTNTSDASFNSNVITTSQWNTLELHGAVFLPAAGSRQGALLNMVGSYGNYWSSDPSRPDSACKLYFGCFIFQGEENNFLYMNVSGRAYGNSVRLVRGVE